MSPFDPPHIPWRQEGRALTGEGFRVVLAEKLRRWELWRGSDLLGRYAERNTALNAAERVWRAGK